MTYVICFCIGKGTTLAYSLALFWSEIIVCMYTYICHPLSENQPSGANCLNQLFKIYFVFFCAVQFKIMGIKLLLFPKSCMNQPVRDIGKKC